MFWTLTYISKLWTVSDKLIKLHHIRVGEFNKSIKHTVHPFFLSHSRSPAISLQYFLIFRNNCCIMARISFLWYMIATVYKKTKKIDIYVCNKIHPRLQCFYNGYGKGFLVKYMIFKLRKRMTANNVGDGQSVAS